MAIYQIHDTHKPTGATFVERISIQEGSPATALDAWWMRSKRNDGGPVDCDRYEAKEDPNG